MLARRNLLVYVALLAVWLLIGGWQVAEHLRVREATQTFVINRARDITSTLGLVMRSQRRFGVISRERFESALNELLRPGDVRAIALLSASGDVVASAGEVGEFDPSRSPTARAGVHWGQDSVAIVNLVDLGTNVAQEAKAPAPTIVLPREQLQGFTNYAPRPPGGTNLLAASGTNGTNLADHVLRPPPGWPWPRGTNITSTNRAFFSRPFWMSTNEYQAAIKRAGAHSFVIVMSAGAVRASLRQDLWLRSLVGLLATAAAGISGFAWRNMHKTHDLQIRLVKASEMNAHLKQMNLAAAGLAHETRNPLNIIRGLAQMISRQADAAPEVREKSRAISEETDRVTAQLNEFINYSRPREARRTPVPLGRVAGEIARALAYDAEEKKVQIKVPEEDMVVEADEQLLRQALFNLLLNAIQSVDNGGQIEVATLRRNGAEISLEVRDNGPGVAPEHRPEIFKPYFTTQERGTGLGLAVVQQIVAAHGWDIECADNPPRGAVFRINRIKAVAKS